MDDSMAILRRAARDRSSGAAQIAAQAARGLARVTASDALPAIGLLLRGHPSMAPLWRLATDVLSAPDPREGVRVFLGRMDADGGAPAVLAPELPPWLLTISYSSTVLETVGQARVRLLTCMRSEPGGEGERMAAAARGIQTRVIPDEEAIRLVPAAAVVVGADAVTPLGLLNKVKTRALAEAARQKGVPCYAVAGETKFAGAEMPAEEPFERVPLELFTAVATPDGLLSPAEARARAEAAPLHPDLLPTLAALTARPR